MKTQKELLLENSVAPIEIFRRDLYSFEEKNIVAYRTSVNINSLDLGVLTPAEYRYVASRSNQCEKLCELTLRKILLAFRDSGDASLESCRFVSFFVPNRILLKRKLLTMIQGVLKDFPDAKLTKLCVEVSSDILFENYEPAIEQLKYLKAMGITVALIEVGEEFTPLYRIRKLAPDIVYFDRNIVATFNTEDEFQVAREMTFFMRNIGAHAYVENVRTLEEKEAADRLYYYGFSNEKVDGKFPPCLDQVEGGEANAN